MTKIKAYCLTEAREVDALCIGPFGIHNKCSDGIRKARAKWTIVHLGTGMNAMQTRTKKQAFDCIKVLLSANLSWEFTTLDTQIAVDTINAARQIVKELYEKHELK